MRGTYIIEVKSRDTGAYLWNDGFFTWGFESNKKRAIRESGELLKGGKVSRVIEHLTGKRIDKKEG